MRRDDGFTLLEVLVALAIAALALGVLFRAGGGGLLSLNTAGRYEEAVSRAKSHLAALGSDVGFMEGNFDGDDGDGYRWRLHIAPVATSRSTSSDVASVTLYAIQVTISWTEGGMDREVELRSERLVRQGRG
jgi:general secretion pathway protein I